MFAILYFLLPIPISMEFRPGVQGIGVFGISLISHRQLCREDSVSLVECEIGFYNCGKTRAARASVGGT